MTDETRQITLLLKRPRKDPGSANELYTAIQSQLQAMARSHLVQERDAHDLQGTILVDEVFQSLVVESNYPWKNREEFFCTAAKVMRRLLVDHARSRNALKRGAGQSPESLHRVSTPIVGASWDPQLIVELDDVIAKLERKHAEVFRVFDLHYFMGCELKEIANDILDIPYIRAKRLRGMAKAFLHRELVGDDSHGS